MKKKHVAVVLVVQSDAEKTKKWIEEDIMGANTAFYTSDYEIILVNFSKNDKDIDDLVSRYASTPPLWFKNIDCRKHTQYDMALREGLLFAKSIPGVDYIVHVEEGIKPSNGFIFQMIQEMERDYSIAIGGTKIYYKGKIVDTGLINDGTDIFIPYIGYSNVPKKIVEDRVFVAPECVIFRPSEVNSVKTLFDDICVEKIRDNKRVCYFPMMYAEAKEYIRSEYVSNILREKSNYSGLLPRIKWIPKVGIVMPAYNSSQFIEDSLNGIVNQTYKNWELFVVDDMSTDDTFEKVENFRKSYSYNKIKVKKNFYGKNDGPSSGRNQALKKILEDKSIEFIAYCDSDDIWLPNHLEDAINEFIKYPETDFVYCDPTCEFEDRTPAIPYGIPHYTDITLEKLREGNSIYISSVVHRTKCLDVGLFDSRLDGIEDWDYWCRIAEAGYNMFHLCLPNIKYIVRKNGVASQRNLEKTELFFEKRRK